MKHSVLCIIFATGLLLLSGCPNEVPMPTDNNGLAGGSGCVFRVSGVHIVGLTTLQPDPQDAFASKLDAYIDLVDVFNSRMKAPGKFRLELYEFVARSGQPEGKRLYIWPDIDLTDARENNDKWQDYLRTYVFYLKTPFRVAGGTDYILQATFLTEDERRLVDTFHIRAR